MAYWDEGKQERRIQLSHDYVHSCLQRQHLAESYGLSTVLTNVSTLQIINS